MPDRKTVGSEELSRVIVLATPTETEGGFL